MGFNRYIRYDERTIRYRTTEPYRKAVVTVRQMRDGLYGKADSAAHEMSSMRQYPR
ncbi:MAG: hypothetical protein LBD29_01095 [Treponema sp.]|nr:hypothetical protein [Treponema sp.]